MQVLRGHTATAYGFLWQVEGKPYDEALQYLVDAEGPELAGESPFVENALLSELFRGEIDLVFKRIYVA